MSQSLEVLLVETFLQRELQVATKVAIFGSFSGDLAKNDLEALAK